MTFDRRPVFADDRWYPSTAGRLSEELERLIQVRHPPLPAMGVVAPHAGYYYSGRVAGELYGSIDVPDRVVVLCPNHTGLGARAAIMVEGNWRIPGAVIPIDEPAAESLLAAAPELSVDVLAHSEEHSLEVQLPFLHARNPAVRLVPICLSRLSFEACRRLGQALAPAIAELDGPTLVVASSDMNHQEPARIGNRKDRLAIDRMLAMDPAGLFETVRSERITMCGVVPAAVMMTCAIARGASACTLVRYMDSGDANQDKSRVVGYAGLTVA